MFKVQVEKEGRDYYTIHFLYDTYIIECIKKLPKKEFIAHNKSWKLNALNLFLLISNFKGSSSIFFEFTDPNERILFIEKYKKSLEKEENKRIEADIKIERNLEIIKFKTELSSQNKIDFDYKKYLNDVLPPFKHQIIAALLFDKANKILFAMGLGSGKTGAAILGVEIKEEKIKKVMVITPNSLKYNWKNEIKLFSKNPKYYILNGKYNEYTPNEAKYFITNFEYFSSSNFNFNDKIKKYGIESPDCFIIDEIHKLSNTSSNRTRVIKDYCKKAKNPFMIGLSGTPISSGKLSDLYSILNFLDPKEFSNKSKFFTDYCGMSYIPAQYGWVQTKDPLLEEMNKKLQHLMYRVKTEDVLKNLPTFRINKVYVDMDKKQQKEYEDIENGLKNIDWVNTSFLAEKKSNGKEMGFLELIGKLRQYTSIIKLETVKEFIKTLNEDGEKVVIFDTYINPLKELYESFKNNSELYYGGVDTFIRQSYVDKFQDPTSPLKNLFMSIQSGSVGITLTSSSNMLMVSQPLTVSDLSQCYGRIYRNGQTKPVTVYTFIVKDSIDEYIDNLMGNKLKVSMKVIDNEDYEDNSTTSLVGDLFNLYKENQNKFKN